MRNSYWYFLQEMAGTGRVGEVLATKSGHPVINKEQIKLLALGYGQRMFCACCNRDVRASVLQ